MCKPKLEDSVEATLAAADRLRTLGEPITPQSLERELRAAELRAAATRAPDPWAAGLDALRTPEQRRDLEAQREAFERIDAQAEAISADVAAHFRALEAENAKREKFPPPDPYAAGLKALKESR